jgi:hypothetical protein
MAVTHSLAGQEPLIQNGEVVASPAVAGLKATVESLTVQASEPVWIAYSVPVIPGGHSMCCYHHEGNGGCCSGCRLEGDGGEFRGIGTERPLPLEPSRRLLVMLRAERGRLEKVGAYSMGCALDAGGRRVYWLGPMDARQSLDYLAGLVESSDWAESSEKRIANSALMAIAHHDGSPADAAMAGFLAAGKPRKLRKQSAFWLGSARGASGFQAVSKAARNDSDERFREDAMFALSVSRENAAVDELVHFAKVDSSAGVRKQALFWLAQKAGKKATGMLTDAIEKDPDTQVKKHAVFALSQLPKEEGVPLLIDVARKNRNPVVRKQAMFWLGQSNDPRALQFFEEVLAQ